MIRIMAEAGLVAILSFSCISFSFLLWLVLVRLLLVQL
jgi:hypothetical protein